MTVEQKTWVLGYTLPIPHVLLDKIHAKDGDYVRVKLRLWNGREYLLPCRRLYGNTISLVNFMHQLGVKNGDAVEILDIVKCTFLDYDAIPLVIADGLKKLIENAQGMCVSFTAERLVRNSEVAENENLVIHPNHYSLAYSMLDAMVKVGLIAYARQKAKRGTRYIICKNSELWDFVKNHEIGDIVDFVRKRIEVVENVR
jgi:antitoxin component of MazEF toxin-antitoxin module